MAYGLATSYANSALDTIGAAAIFVQLHTGDPGAAGTGNVSSVTTRQSVTWNAASAGSKTMSNVPNWGTWAGTNNEVLAYLSFWTLVTAGTFVFSLPISAGTVTMQTGFPLTLAAETITLGQLAA